MLSQQAATAAAAAVPLLPLPLPLPTPHPTSASAIAVWLCGLSWLLLCCHELALPCGHHLGHSQLHQGLPGAVGRAVQMPSLHHFQCCETWEVCVMRFHVSIKM